MCFATNRCINKPLNFSVSEIGTVLRTAEQLQPCTCGSSCWRTPPEGHHVQSKPSRSQQAPSSGTHGPSHHGCLGSRGKGSRTPRGAGSPARLSPNHRARLQSWLPNITEQRWLPPHTYPLISGQQKPGCEDGASLVSSREPWHPPDSHTLDLATERLLLSESNQEWGSKSKHPICQVSFHFLLKI